MRKLRVPRLFFIFLLLTILLLLGCEKQDIPEEEQQPQQPVQRISYPPETTGDDLEEAQEIEDLSFL